MGYIMDILLYVPDSLVWYQLLWTVGQAAKTN